MSFSTAPTKPSVTIMTVGAVDFSKMTAVFKASIDNVGIPAYTEKGFVYSASNSNPSLTSGNVIKASGTAAGYFETTATGLELNKTYYVKAYASNAGGTSYSNATSFNTNETLPVVSTDAPTDVNIDKLTAILHATISDAGTPSYTERGFVYSTEYEEPTIYDTKIVVDGTGTGPYEYRLTNFATDKITYIRAYVKNQKGIAYGDAKALFIPAFMDMGDYIVLGSLGIAVQKTDIGAGLWSDMSALCKNSTIGGFTDWRLPTIDELSSLYELKDEIGNFETSTIGNPDYNYYKFVYWSSSYYNTYTRYCMSFINGKIDYMSTSINRFSARAVRTINK